MIRRQAINGKRSRSPLLRRGGFGQRCRRSAHWDVFRDLNDESGDDEVDRQRSHPATGAAWLPPGCVLKASVTLASSPDDPVPVVDFSKIAKEQLLEQSNQRSEKPEEGAQFGPLSGNCDALSRTIRSMEGRLANHGILAAPSTILAKAHRWSKGGATEDESFYKACDEMDGFIDDSLLEDLNADDMQFDHSVPQTRDEQSCGGITNGDIAHATSFDPFGARLELWDDSVTGTSQHSGSDSDCSSESTNAPQPGICSWRERLPTMIQELVWISDDVGEVTSATPASNSVCDLMLAFDDCCSAVEASDGGDHSLLEACRLLQSNFPSLVRPLSQRGCWKAPVVAKIPNDSTTFRCGDKEIRLFPLTMEEEVSWAHFTWRLIRFAMPRLRKSTFVSQWLEAATELQHKYEVQARSLWVESVREVLSVEEFRTIEAIAKQTASKETAGRCKHLVDILLTVVDGLWQRYVRRRFWQAQKQRRSLDASADYDFVKMRRNTATGFAYFATARLGDEIHAKIPLQFLTQHLHARTFQKSSIYPLQLPIQIVIRVNDSEVCGSLLSVQNFHAQQVQLLARGGAFKKFTSLQKAAQWVCRGLSGTPQNILNSLKEAAGGWKVCSVVRGGKYLTMVSILNHGEKLKCSVFRNPKKMGLCPTLPSLGKIGLINTQYRLRKEKNDLLSRLQPGQWLSCKYFGEAATAKRYYNVYVQDVCRDEDTGVCTHLKVRWFNGEIEDGVAPSRIAPVYRYAVHDSVAVYDRGQWWQGSVTKVVENCDDFAERLYEVSMGEHVVTVKLDRLRRDYGTTRQPTAQAQAGDQSSIVLPAPSQAKVSSTNTQHSPIPKRTADQNSVATHKGNDTATEVYAKSTGKGKHDMAAVCSVTSSSSGALGGIVRHKKAPSPPRSEPKISNNNASSSSAALGGLVQYRNHAQSLQRSEQVTMNNTSLGSLLDGHVRVKTPVLSLPSSLQTAGSNMNSSTAVLSGHVRRRKDVQSLPKLEQATVRNEGFQRGQRCRVRIQNKWSHATVVEDLGNHVVLHQAGQTIQVDRNDVEALLKPSDRAIIDVKEPDGVNIVDLD